MRKNLEQLQAQMRLRPRRTKKKSNKKRRTSLAELSRRLAARQALLEIQQAAMRARNSTPAARERSAKVAKGLARQKARLAVKQALSDARKMKRTLAYQRKRYREHKLEFKRKVTWAMRAQWKLTTDTWQGLRTAMLEAEQRLTSATKAYEDVTVGVQRSRDITAGWKLGLEHAKAQEGRMTQ
jgi:hypothetical protein